MNDDMCDTTMAEVANTRLDDQLDLAKQSAWTAVVALNQNDMTRHDLSDARDALVAALDAATQSVALLSLIENS